MSHQLEQLLSRRVGELRIVDVQIQLDDLDRRATPDRIASCSARRAAGSSNGCPSLSIADTPRPGSRIATGPFAPRAASARCRRRSRAFSSGVVRISVTLALCR